MNIYYNNVEQYIVGEKALMFDNYEIYNDIITVKPNVSYSARIVEIDNHWCTLKNGDEQLWTNKHYKLIKIAITTKFLWNEFARDILLSTEDNILCYVMYIQLIIFGVVIQIYLVNV